MKIIKRNGAEVPFDITKIITAVTKASDSVGGKARLSREQITDIAAAVTDQCQALNRAVSVEEIQDMVENKLMDMKAQDLFPYLENMNVCVGPCTEDMLPADANADNTVCIGICCKKLADAKGFRWVVGCPPGNADVVKGILGDRLEYGVRYN